MSRAGKHFTFLLPAVTVFISNGCIMILAIVAHRLLARFVGSSLYSRTAVFAVLLAGIAAGSYIGGQLADSFNCRRILAVAFGLCSIASVLTIATNNVIGEWTFLWRLDLPARVFTHVAFVLFLPSALLGTINPVVAKMALDKSPAKGKTVGNTYALSAAGAIAGTLLAGFCLIPAFGTTAIIWSLAVVLLLTGIPYQKRFGGLHCWGIILAVLLFLAMAPGKWTQKAGLTLRLRKKHDPSILYETESSYSYIAVRQLSKKPDIRQLIQDNTKNHSRIVMGDIQNLELLYTRVFAAVTHQVAAGKGKLNALMIGSGGYVFARYLEQLRPGSRVDVAEIDPAVTKAAIEAFGLSPNPTIKTVNMDGRNYVDELIEKRRSGRRIVRYDFVYMDAFNDWAIPWQLVTYQFNAKVSAVMAGDGVYMVNLIDICDTGRFLGSFLNTIGRCFPYVYVISGPEPHGAANNFIVAAAKRELNLKNLDRQKALRGAALRILSESEISRLVEKAGGIVLTDDYAPVENLLAPLVLSNSPLPPAQRHGKQ